MRRQREVFGWHVGTTRWFGVKRRRDPVEDFGHVAGEPLEVQSSVLEVLRDAQRLMNLRAGGQTERPAFIALRCPGVVNGTGDRQGTDLSRPVHPALGERRK